MPEYERSDREKPEKEQRTPVIYGRFNYLPIGENTFNILFISEFGVSVIVAANIPEYVMAIDLVDDLNQSLYDTKKTLLRHYGLAAIPKLLPIQRVNDDAD